MVEVASAAGRGADGLGFGPAGRAAGTQRPRGAGASAGGVGGKAAGHGGGGGRRQRLRLTGSSQSHQIVQRAGRGRGLPGEPGGDLWSRLTERDRRILDLLAEHHVLTTDHLTYLLFPSRSRAQHRLLELTRMGVLFRAQPYRAAGGSKPFHYLLGYRGAELLAAQAWADPPRPSVHANWIRRTLESPRLGHLLGVNDFFAALAALGRRAGLAEGEGLLAWHSEDWVRDHDPASILPDGYGLWVEGGRALGFYLEHDTGTESLSQVAEKMDRYQRRRKYQPATARLLRGMVLFSVASRRREDGLRNALWTRCGPIPVATTNRALSGPLGPAAEVWSLLTAEPRQARRVRLGDLPRLIGGTQPDGAPTILTTVPEFDDPDPDWLADDEAHDDKDDMEADAGALAETDVEVETIEIDAESDDPEPAPSPPRPSSRPPARRHRPRWWPRPW
ncbi:replication-relaxation family protein [Streptomyces phytophilus]|uniref:replication-relaxation family protein n=1 Tax=Streptomyces phytophilus TaxID=722715 RepID=UPI00215D771E|nr:replication-relaxation family protein [Streptomyces phytophilus]